MKSERLPDDDLIHVGPNMARAILKFDGLKPRFKKEVTAQAARVLLTQDRVFNPEEPDGPRIADLIDESDSLLKGLNFSGHIEIVKK